tara:strand:+ start:1452 stop:1688 length:237 start_codon:yes stop_codon:yes gene_type:complete
MKSQISKFTNLIFKRQRPLVLGRWSVEKSSANKNKLADYANEDHCGPCGMVPINKIERHYKHVERTIDYYKKKNKKSE